MPVCMLMKQERKGIDLDGWENIEDMGRVVVWEIIIRIYCIK